VQEQNSLELKNKQICRLDLSLDFNAFCVLLQQFMELYGDHIILKRHRTILI